MGEKAPAVPDPPKVQIVAPNGAPTTFVNFSLWDNAFQTTQANKERLEKGNPKFVGSRLELEDFNTLRNGPKPEESFVDGDSQHFQIRVVDPSARSRRFVEVNWKCLGANGASVAARTATRLTLMRVGTSDPPTFLSRAVMVTSFHDDMPAVHSGLPGNDPDEAIQLRSKLINVDEAEYRLRHGVLGGSVEVTYESPSGQKAEPARAAVVNPGAVKTLTVRFLALRLSPGSDSMMGSNSANDFFEHDMRAIIEVYSQIGVRVVSDVRGLAGSFKGKTMGRDVEIALIDPPPNVSTNFLHRDHQRAVGTANKAPPGMVQVIFADRISAGDSPNGEDFNTLRGVAYTDSVVAQDGLSADLLNTVFISHRNKTSHTTAHEIGHVLCDKGPSEGHYSFLADPFALQQHLMRHGGGPGASTAAHAHFGNRRIWDQRDRDGFNYFGAMRRSSLLK